MNRYVRALACLLVFLTCCIARADWLVTGDSPSSFTGEAQTYYMLQPEVLMPFQDAPHASLDAASLGEDTSLALLKDRRLILYITQSSRPDVLAVGREMTMTFDDHEVIIAYSPPDVGGEVLLRATTHYEQNGRALKITLLYIKGSEGLQLLTLTPDSGNSGTFLMDGHSETTGLGRLLGNYRVAP